MDFSRVHTLQLGGGYRNPLDGKVAHILPPIFPAYGHSRSMTPLARYSSSVSPKPRLGIYLVWRNGWDSEAHSANSPLEPVLRQHGATLETLYFHAPEHETWKQQRPVLSLKQLQLLVELAPNLSKLTLDLCRTETKEWPWEELKVIVANLPRLVDLTSYFDLASDCHRQWPPTRPYYQYHPSGVISSFNRPTQPIPRTNITDHSPQWTPAETINSSGPPPPAAPSASLILPPTPLVKSCHPSSDSDDRDHDDDPACIGLAQYAQPMLNKTMGREVARFLWKHKAGNRQLERLRLRSGNPPLCFDYSSSHGYQWIDHKYASVTCHGEERWGMKEANRKKDGCEDYGGGQCGDSSSGGGGGGGDDGEEEEGKREKEIPVVVFCEARENLCQLREWMRRCDPASGWEKGEAEY